VQNLLLYRRKNKRGKKKASPGRYLIFRTAPNPIFFFFFENLGIWLVGRSDGQISSYSKKETKRDKKDKEKELTH
jgi:hypothetical protein